ncbi:tetratricopeptide repeat protein [Streptomyces mirabilis]|uniref:tetratricopeptide repeat protein n=1 Tax=Streptomyces mirabilis TaxID=68239 RepID=UPI0036B0B9EC
MQIGQVVLGREHSLRSAPVTLAPPVGDRDPAFPLRGRKALLGALLKLGREGGDGRLHVLHGLGGCGKTAVALELVYLLQNRPHGSPPGLVWWVDARQAVMLDSGFRALAQQAGLNREEASAGWAADALWKRLAQVRHGWVLVVDNVDDPTVLDGPGRLSAGTGWLRPHVSPAGLVLVTTREGTARTWGPTAVLHSVDPLPAPVAARVLLDHAGHRAGSNGEARALARRLGGLPLALRMAGSYLAEVIGMPGAFRDPDTPAGFTDYRQALDGPSGSGLNPAQAIGETWRLSVDYLHSHGFPYAGPVLDLLATFADAPIPHTLLLRPAALARIDGDFAELDGPALWRTLNELSALGLVDVDGSSADVPPTVRLHPLIRDASGSRLRVAQAAGLLEQAMQMEEVGAPEEPRSWQVWHTLAPHAQELLRHASDTGLDTAVRASLAEAAERAGRYLRARGLPHQASEQFERVLTVCHGLWGPDHASTLSCQQNLARALHDLGQWERARDLYETVWRGNSEVEGPEHPHSLIARHELGRVLHDSGALVAARQHLSSVLEVHRRVRGEEHRYTLTARHELARVLHDEGDLHEAQGEYQQVLAVRRRVLGDEHPRTLTARHNLACVLDDLGEHDAAQKEFLLVLSARKRVLGVEHPSALSTQYRLGRVAHACGEADRARLLLTQVEEIASRTLGVTHPQTVKARRALEEVEGAE